ncbi:MAG: trigger factor [Thermoanaerobaculia bacterium]
MSVVVSIEDLGGSQKQVKVAVPAPAVEAETNRVTAEYRKHARIPGFRKGKVPASLVKQRFGEDIEREVVERLVPRYWKQAEAESELVPLLSPEVGSVDFELGSELTFVATIDLRPEFELGNIDSFEFPEEPGSVTDEEVDGALEELRRSVAEWKTADRSAAQGDRVVAVITHKDAGEAESDDAGEGSEPAADSESGSAPDKTTFEVGDPNVWEELSVAATGLTAGQGSDFERETLEDGELQKREFRLRVETVQERDLPPLDDAFAERFGKFDDLADMKKGVRENMTRSREEDHRRNRRGALIEQLCERHPFELPKRVVREEARQLLEEYARGLAHQGVDVEKAGIDWQKMGEEFTPQAEKRVRARLVLDAVAKKLELATREEELEAALGDLARSQGRSSGLLRQELDRAGRLADLREQLLRDKTMKTLLGEADPEPDGETVAEALDEATGDAPEAPTRDGADSASETDEETG